MIRLLALALLVALAFVPHAEASSGVHVCVFGNAGVCVVAEGDCAGVGFGLQGVGACSRGGCTSVFLGFNQIGTCGLP